MTADPWITLSEGGAYAHVHPATLRREIKAGRLVAYRIGGRKSIRLKASAIDAWLEASHTPVQIRPGGAR